jgi:hypothetical protein
LDSVLFLCGDFTGAADAFRRSVGIATARATGSGDVYVHYYAALVYKGLGDDRRAIAETRRAREAGYPASLLRGEPEFAPVIRRPEIAALVRETGN